MKTALKHGKKDLHTRIDYNTWVWLKGFSCKNSEANGSMGRMIDILAREFRMKKEKKVENVENAVDIEL